MSNETIQWVKPLIPGDIPKDTYPVWNTATLEWNFKPIEDLHEPVVQLPDAPATDPTLSIDNTTIK
jgi:hypothetical protein